MSLQSSATMEMPGASAADCQQKQGIGDLLAVGFGTTVAMWAIGYVALLPGVQAPPQWVMASWLACVIGGGVVVGRWGRHGWLGGLWTGIITSLLNLLVLGSVLTDDLSPEMRKTMGLWLLGYFGLCAVCGGGGAILGFALRPPKAADAIGGFTVNWKAGLAWVAVGATGLLILAGGLVTGLNAGLAVPDWPTSFEMVMFLFPLSRMTHGIYFEHAHRLLGSLVGLTCLTTAIYLTCVEKRRWLVALMWITGSLVAVQAVAGGLRVVLKDQDIAIVHGILAQIVLALLASIAIFCSRRFAARQSACIRPGAGVDHLLTKLLVAALLVQLTLGALVRHENFQVLAHIGMAVIVMLLVLVVGMRAVSLNENIRLLRRLGIGLLVLVCVQVIAGINALVQGGYGDTPPAGAITMPQPSAVQAFATTLHQTNGAVLLVCAVAIMVWSHRLLVEPAAESAVAVGPVERAAG